MSATPRRKDRGEGRSGGAASRARKRKPSARAAALAILRDATGQAPVRLARKAGGLTNVVYAAEMPGGERLILRMSPGPDKVAVYMKERWAMELAAKAGVPVPETLAVDAHGSGFDFMVQRAVPGQDATDHPDRLTLLREMGRLTRLIHGIRTTGFGQEFDTTKRRFTGAANWRDYVAKELRVEERLDVLNRNRMLSRQQASRLEGMMLDIVSWDVEPVLNHGDMRLKNVMAVGEGATITAVLDWEFCSSNVAPYWDLSLALHDLTIDAKHVFLEGYGLEEDEIVAISDVIKAINIINYAPYVAKAAEERNAALLAQYRTRFSGALDLYSL
jgi:hygromycin-B 4-O-kinase